MMAQTDTAEPALRPRKNAAKTRGRPFAKGNPGRPHGARNRATVVIEDLLEGEAEAIGRKCVELAIGGDTTALRLAMDRIAPVRRGRPVTLTLPPVSTSGDVVAAIGSVLQAVGAGEITLEEGQMVAIFSVEQIVGIGATT